MAGDLKRFLFEEKQSLGRYQSNLDAIIEKYNKPFDDNKVDLDIDNYSVIKGKDILQKKSPLYFGLCKLPYTKVKDHRWKNERSYDDESDGATDHESTDRYTSGYGSKLTTSSSGAVDSMFVDPLNMADDYSVCVEDNPLLYTNTHQHQASETFSLAEQNADVEDTEQLLALKETMLTFIASDTEEPSDAETIRSSSTCGSDEWADGFECLSDSDEEVISNRHTPLHTNKRSRGSPYDRGSNISDACKEVDGEIRQDRQFIRTVHNNTKENNHHIEVHGDIRQDRQYMRNTRNNTPEHRRHDEVDRDIRQDRQYTRSVRNNTPEHRRHDEVDGDILQDRQYTRSVRNNTPEHRRHDEVDGDILQDRQYVRNARNNTPEYRHHNEVDRDIMQDRQYVRSACKDTPEQRYQKRILFSSCKGSYDSFKNKESFRSPSTTGNGLCLDKDDSLPSSVNNDSSVKEHVSHYHNLFNSNEQDHVNKLPIRNSSQRSSEMTCERGNTDEANYLRFLKTRMLNDIEKPQNFNQQMTLGYERVKTKELPKEQRKKNCQIFSRKFNVLPSSQKDEICFSGKEDRKTEISNTADRGKYQPLSMYQRMVESGQDIQRDNNSDHTGNKNRPKVLSGFHRNQSVTELNGKENVVQIFNRMSAKQGPDRDLQQRNSIIDRASNDILSRTESTCNGDLSGRETGIQVYPCYKEVPQDPELHTDKYLENEAVERKVEPRNNYLQSNCVYRSAPPKHRCDLKDLPNGLSGSGFEEDKMPAIEKVYRWLSPVHDDTSDDQQCQIKARRRLHLAAPVVSDTLDKKRHLHSKEKDADTYQQATKHQNKWVSKSAMPKVYQPYARTKPESPSTVFSRMKLNTPSPSHKSSEMSFKKEVLSSPAPRHALFSRKQEELETLGRKDVKTSLDMRNVSSSTHSNFMNQQNVSTHAQRPTEGCYTPSRTSFTEQQQFSMPTRSNSVDRLSVKSKPECLKPSFSSSRITNYCTPSRLSKIFDSGTSLNHEASVLQSSNETNSTHHKTETKPTDWLEASNQSIPNSEESMTSINTSVGKQSSKAFVLSGTPNENHRSSMKCIDQNERNVLPSRTVNSQTFVRYTDEYTFKSSDEESSDNVRKSHGKQIPYSNFQPSSRFVCDKQISEDVVPGASVRAFSKGRISTSFNDCHDRVVAKREKRFTSPSRITHVYKSPVKSYLDRNNFSPGSKKALVTVSSKAKLQLMDKDTDSISRLDMLENKCSKTCTPVRSLVKSSQPSYTKNPSSKMMDSQKPCTESRLSRFVALKEKLLINDQSHDLNCNRFTQSTPRKPDVVFSLNDTLSTICNEHSNDKNMYGDSDSSEDTVLTIK